MEAPTPAQDRAYYTPVDVLIYSIVIGLLVLLVCTGVMLMMKKTTVPLWLYMTGTVTVGVALIENAHRMKASNESTRRIDENLAQIQEYGYHG